MGTFVLGSEGGYRDVAMIMDCDTAVAKVCEQCGWSDDLKDLTKTEVCMTKSEQPRTSQKPLSAPKRTNKTEHVHIKKK